MKFWDELVSVIIPTYNRSSRLGRSIASVIAQDHRPIEIVVVDDGSTDDTKDSVEKLMVQYKNEPQLIIKYIVQQNSGAPTARNTGVKSSTGRYIQFLDSDDLLMPTKVSKQLELLKAEKTPICLCDYLYVDEQDNIVRRISNNLPINRIIRHFVGISTSVPLIDRTFFDQNDLMWNTSLKRLQDIDYYVKLLLLVDKISYLEQFYFKLVVHDDGRITTSARKAVYLPILKSVVNFWIRNFNKISHTKFRPLLALCLKLFYRSLGLGKLPAQLKVAISEPPRREMIDSNNS